MDSDEGTISFSEYYAEFRREVWLMSGFQHENIVSLIGICNKPICMILELCNGGNLYDWAHGRNVPKTEEEFLQSEKLAVGVAKGMAFLHSTNPPIIHRDLKTPNILLVKDGTKLTAKIADFGLSRGLVWNKDLIGKVVDNPVWLAPEILLGKPYTEKVDIYAFGVILWELISGEKTFFGDESFMAKIEDKIKNGEREVIPKDCFIPKYYEYLINVCWDQDFENRPSFDQCLEKFSNQDDTPIEADPSRLVLTLTYESIIKAIDEENKIKKETNQSPQSPPIEKKKKRKKKGKKIPRISQFNEFDSKE